MSLFTRFARGTASKSLARTYATTVTEASGVKVAGYERGAPAGTVNLTVVVKAGGRYETKPGVAHVLKNFAFKSTSQGSALKIARETELYGGVLSAALSREHLFLTAEFLRGDEQHFLSLLASVLSSTQFLPHEYAELVLPNVQTESVTARSDPHTLSLDLAHQIAFRRGLGNSLFAQQHSPISIDDVRTYGQQAFAKSNIAVLGGGISTDALASAVQKAFGGAGGNASSLNAGTTQYFGGETRVAIDTHHSHTHQPTLTIAYGNASAPSADLKVLPHLIGGASSVKWCAGTSPLSLAAEKIPGAKIETALLPYSDASLFTVTITAPTSEGVRTLAQEVSKHVKSLGDVKDEGVKKAIAQAKVAEASKFGTSAGLLSVVAPSIFKGDIPSADSSFSALDKVSASSVSKAASELFKAKPTIVAVGDIASMPYGDEVGF